MEYRIGEIIDVREKELHSVQVVENTSCYGCYFMYYCKHHDHKSITRQYGECSEMERKDAKNIIFKCIN